MTPATLRKKGFSVYTLGGPVTQLIHKRPFTVNGKAARSVADRYEFILRGWYPKSLPHNIKLEEE